MPNTVTNEDSFKLLYGVLKLANVKPPMVTLGAFMGLEPGTAHMRYYTLMKKLEKEHGEVDVQRLTSATSGGGGRKRKRAQKEDQPQKKCKADQKSDEIVGADVKGEAGHDSAEDQEA